MIEYEEKQVTRSVMSARVCDRCKKRFSVEEAIEFWRVYHQFENGKEVECDLCQHCAQEILEPYWRVTEGDGK